MDATSPPAALSPEQHAAAARGLAAPARAADALRGHHVDAITATPGTILGNLPMFASPQFAEVVEGLLVARHAKDPVATNAMIQLLKLNDALGAVLVDTELGGALARAPAAARARTHV